MHARVRRSRVSAASRKTKRALYTGFTMARKPCFLRRRPDGKVAEEGKPIQPAKEKCAPAALKADCCSTPPDDTPPCTLSSPLTLHRSGHADLLSRITAVAGRARSDGFVC